MAGRLREYTIPCRVLFQNFFEVQGVCVPVQAWMVCVLRVHGESYNDAMQASLYNTDEEESLELVSRGRMYTVAPICGIPNDNVKCWGIADNLIREGVSPSGEWLQVGIPIELIDID